MKRTVIAVLTMLFLLPCICQAQDIPVFKTGTKTYLGDYLKIKKQQALVAKLREEIYELNRACQQIENELDKEAQEEIAAARIEKGAFDLNSKASFKEQLKQSDRKYEKTVEKIRQKYSALKNTRTRTTKQKIKTLSQQLAVLESLEAKQNNLKTDDPSWYKQFPNEDAAYNFARKNGTSMAEVIYTPRLEIYIGGKRVHTFKDVYFHEDIEEKTVVVESYDDAKQLGIKADFSEYDYYNVSFRSAQIKVYNRKADIILDKVFDLYKLGELKLYYIDPKTNKLEIRNTPRLVWVTGRMKHSSCNFYC